MVSKPKFANVQGIQFLKNHDQRHLNTVKISYILLKPIYFSFFSSYKHESECANFCSYIFLTNNTYVFLHPIPFSHNSNPKFRNSSFDLVKNLSARSRNPCAVIVTIQQDKIFSEGASVRKISAILIFMHLYLNVTLM